MSSPQTIIADLRQRLERERTLTVIFRVRAGARYECIHEILEDGSIKVDVVPSAERGRANAALQKFLANILGIKPAAIEIISGHTSRIKVVRLTAV